MTLKEREKRILELLEEHGEMETGRIAGALQMYRHMVWPVLSKMRKKKILVRRKAHMRLMCYDGFPASPWRFFYRINDKQTA